MPSLYLNQCWNNFDWAHRNKLQLNFNLNSNIFNKLHLKMFSVKWRPFCVGLDGLICINTYCMILIINYKWSLIWQSIFLMLRQGHSRITRLISWLLMPWRCRETRLNQQWIWFNSKNKSVSSSTYYFTFLCHLNIENYKKFKCLF